MGDSSSDFINTNRFLELLTMIDRLPHVVAAHMIGMGRIG
jgi:hypothetical protein